MPDSPNRIYWDACVFLAFVNGDAGRAEVIQQLLDEAAAGAFELFTSTVSQVEVAFGKAEQDGVAPDPTFLAAIEAFWLPESPVRLIEFHRLIATDARDLVRAEHFDGKKLTPLDAIHLASAQRVRASECHTYDGKLLNFKGLPSLAIREPWTATPRIPGME